MAVGEATAGSPTVSVDRSLVLSIGRLDWIIAILGVWLIGGFYVDIWAHNHGRVDDTFFTPWHANLYAGALSIGLVLGALALVAIRRGATWRTALPQPYAVSFIGSILFFVTGLFDVVWHEMVGFEVDTEALLSPAHLLLATSGILMLSGPIRSVWGRAQGIGGWAVQGPVVLSLAMVLAVLVAFTQYVNPVVDAWAATPSGGTAVPPAQVFQMAADGSSQRRITIDENDVRGPSLSPDGSTLLVNRNLGDATQIFAMEPDGSNPRQLTTQGRNSGARWSPDGNLIAFEHADTAESTYDVFVMNADGSASRLLVGGPGEDWGPAWSPDGRRIAFTSDRSGELQLYVVGVADGTVEPLTDGPGSAVHPSWSPDGSSIAYAAWHENDSEIHSISTAGSGERALTDTPDDASYMPAWSPAGDRIAFVTGRDGDLEVYVMNADGSDPVNLSRNPGAEDGWAAPSWSADGSTIFYPVQPPAQAHFVDWVRQNLGLAGVLAQAALLAAVVLFLLRREAVPLGGIALLAFVPAAMATVVNDEYRFIPMALVGGILAEIVVRLVGYGRSSRRDAAVAFGVPAVFFATYFATVALTDGIGWSLHLWLGAIATAGIVGLLLEVLMRSPASARARAVEA